jgi:hypothetical protein
MVAALHDTGSCPRAGRPTGTLQDTIVEVGSDPRSWTVLSADQVPEIRSTRVRSIPIEPTITIAGSVVVSADSPSGATECVAAAFRDDAAD